MKIVIAPDSWKESLSALEVASAIEQGFREIYPDAEYVKLPVADGGEGTVEAMVAATGGLLVPLTVTGPLGEPVEAFLRAVRRSPVRLYRNGGGQRPGERPAGAA
ncbi:glycerate kinase [Klebsiella pneumoniae]|uniref:Glycerate kinase n=1 Tax=Klebsiella pneumoniae TaxID=573 RepID=A0A378FQY0_KLEPN|nr:glycerate kinase [Klebsiella pneumoniae]